MNGESDSSAPPPWIVRPLRDHDSLEDLTKLINRAYQRLAKLGLKYVATWQGVDITTRRVHEGQCFLAATKEEILGTIVYHDQALTKGCNWYDRPDVSSFHQFAVEPRFQKFGLGAALMDQVEQCGRDSGAKEIALDTAEQASHLIQYYEKRGYRHVGFADWKETNYRSVILSLSLA
ncbi:MAG: GNAT family N-acetyltransferase [Planctomycetota bacterium]|nr:GNAT family N-acetyltransferase [Planctomycetota bacterium]